MVEALTIVNIRPVTSCPKTYSLQKDQSLTYTKVMTDDGYSSISIELSKKTTEMLLNVENTKPPT